MHVTLWGQRVKGSLLTQEYKWVPSHSQGDFKNCLLRGRGREQRGGEGPCNEIVSHSKGLGILLVTFCRNQGAVWQLRDSFACVYDLYPLTPKRE